MRFSSEGRTTAVPLLRLRFRKACGTEESRLRATHFTASQSEQRRGRGAALGFDGRRQTVQCGRRPEANLSMDRLFRRALPSKRRWCSIDTASKPSSTTPHSSTRALDESMPSHLALKCEIASESCVPMVMYWARRRVCRLIDLVSSSSTKDTSLSFHESAVLA